MVYVIYDPSSDRYLNDRGGYSEFGRATKFDSAYDAEYELDTTDTALKVVGPCIEGETP